MPLAAETALEIETHVRGGFHERDRIVEIFSEEAYEPGELDPDEVNAAVDAAIAAHEAEKSTWPTLTDCDKLDAAFAALNGRGVIALQNVGYTQSDGHDGVHEAYSRVPEKGRIVGYCFYHGQDLERAVAGNGLWLAFGPSDPDDEETLGPSVGRIVVEELKRVGFEVNWNGTFDARIHVPRLDWKRR